MRSDEDPTEKPADAAENLDAVIKDNMPTYIYPYFINSYQLMASKNEYITQLQSLNKFTSKLVITNLEPAAIGSLYADTTRNIKISNQDISNLSEAETQETIDKTFGVNAKNIIEQHNQNLTYMVLTPVQNYFMKGNYLLYTGSKTQENIFLYDNRLPLRTTETEFAYINVPQDRDFMLDEKLAEIKVPHPKKTLEENKRDVELTWRSAWKLKYNCKVLARATADGYEVLGIGTDDPLVVCAYLGSEKMAKLVGDMLDTTLEIEASTTQFLAKMQAKLEVAQNSKIDAISKKITNLEKVLEKIKLFKNGELSFPQFVKIIGDLSRISVDIPHTGPISQPLNRVLNTVGFHKASGTTAIQKKNALKLEEILNQMIADAQPLLQKELNDTSKEVHFKEKFNFIAATIKDYLANRDKTLSRVSRKFDSERGNLRAMSYLSLLEQAQTSLGQAIIIYALLNGKGTELKSNVVNLFSPMNENEIKESLKQVINTALPAKILQDTAMQLANNITVKAESNKRVNFEEEFKTMTTLEVGRTQPRLGS